MLQVRHASPSPQPDGERDILAMEADLQFTKGNRRNYKRYVIRILFLDIVVTNYVQQDILSVRSGRPYLRPGDIDDCHRHPRRCI